MQVKKTSAENIEELMEIRLEMLREVNGLAPDAAFDSDLVAHSQEYFFARRADHGLCHGWRKNRRMCFNQLHLSHANL